MILLLIRERLNWGKVKMEHTAINCIWFIIHVVQYAVPMNSQYHVPKKDMYYRPKDFILNCWRERILKGKISMLQNAMWMFFLCTEYPLHLRSIFSLAWVTTWCKKFLRDHLCLIRMLRTPIYKKLCIFSLQNYRPTNYEVRLLPQHEASSLSQWVYHAGFANY